MGSNLSQSINPDNGFRGSRNRRRNCKRYDSCHESVISSKAHERDSPEVEPESASVVSTANLVTDIINEAAQPKLSDQDRKLIIRSWKIIDSQISQVGLSSYLELFRRAPESLAVFPFLKQLSPEDLEFYAQLKNHSIRVTGVLSMLIKQLEQDSDKADESIREVLLELGRRHFSYGANTSHMELLGRVFVESLQPLFNTDPEYEAMQKAWINFFRVIVFWLQTGFRFVQFKGNAKLIY